MDPTLTLNDWPGENVLEMSTRSLLSDINILLHQRFFFERINYIYIYMQQNRPIFCREYNSVD